MKNKKILFILVLLVSLTFTNALAAGISNAAASGGSASKSKVWGYIYKGALKINSNSKYGIELTNKDGTKKFVVFDSNGQKLAKGLVKTAGLKAGETVSVNGIIKNNIVQVKSITKAEVKEQTFTGWLGDSDCTPHLKDPSEMGTSCLTCPKCEASGYGISVRQTDGSYKFYKFDTNGHKLAKENIISKTSSEKVPEIVVKGVLEGNVIKVSSIALK